MINRVPKLRNEAVGQSLLDFRVIAQVRNELDCSLHDHGLVILLRLTLEFTRDDLEQCLQVYSSSAFPSLHVSTHMLLFTHLFREDGGYPASNPGGCQLFGTIHRPSLSGEVSWKLSGAS